MMLDHLLGHQHLRRQACSLLYQQLLQYHHHHHHQQSPYHQRASTSASMMRGLIAASTSALMRWCGDTSPPMAVSEAGASGAPTLLVRGMMITYWWDCDDESIFRVFHMFAENYIRKTFSIARSSLVKTLWLVNEIWLQLQVYWASEGFQQESSKNKANRAAKPTTSSTVYRGGSSSVGMHKRKLEAELGRSLKQMEVFERWYKKKEDDDGGRGRLRWRRRSKSY
ncbi:UNVERIFIED_CONTAM: hypothetical protein Slati_2396200 [Sesamum latifolium]|uniref:Uncharacterized protein n=1 Tax=Sesamum latifolium TaxID=2727402 RepID=A0AAW2WBX8_9LAMI